MVGEPPKPCKDLKSDGDSKYYECNMGTDKPVICKCTVEGDYFKVCSEENPKTSKRKAIRHWFIYNIQNII